MQQLAQLRRVLHAEMGVEPAQETLVLAQQIVVGEFGPPARAAVGTPADLADESPSPSVKPALGHPIAGPPLLDLCNILDLGPFFGRLAEQQQITHWLLQERCHLVAILGLGGIGKTSLAAQCVHALAAASGDEPYDAIF